MTSSSVSQRAVSLHTVTSVKNPVKFHWQGNLKGVCSRSSAHVLKLVVSGCIRLYVGSLQPIFQAETLAQVLPRQWRGFQPNQRRRFQRRSWALEAALGGPKLLWVWLLLLLLSSVRSSTKVPRRCWDDQPFIANMKPILETTAWFGEENHCE